MPAPITVGAVGADVAALHTALVRQGIQLPASEVSRQFFGPATRQAVLQIQSTNGLPATGEVDAATTMAVTVPSQSVAGTPVAQTLNRPIPPVAPTRAAAAGLLKSQVVTPIAVQPTLQRIPASLDPLSTSADGLSVTLQPFRLAATTRVYAAIDQIRQNIDVVRKALRQPTLPTQIIGVLQQPDGSPAVRVQLQFDPASVNVTGNVATTVTRDNGAFTLTLSKSPIRTTDPLTLTAHGATSNVHITIPANPIAANGMVGVLTLPQTVTPLPTSILGSLANLATTPTKPETPPVAPPPAQKPLLTIGESGSVCTQSYVAAETTDRFPWGVFFRIVEPRMSVMTATQAVPGAGGRAAWLTVYATQSKGAGATTQYVDRVPVDQPLSADGFRDRIAGIDLTGQFGADEKVPMAASLGLGYVLNLAQEWTFRGLGLGDLIYSLPLAPGEQQQVAVFERHDTASVTESEFFSESEAMSQSALSDTSTNATFTSAFNENAHGGSKFQTDSSSASVGGSLIVVSAGGGWSSSSGSTSSWLDGHRDTTQNAAQSTHSSAEVQASARRSANRTGMRLATTSESMGVTTKTITNHNHTRALTMQYWEVLRVYDVTTAIDGLSLVCLVPMQVVRFMPPGQPAALTNPAAVTSRSAVLARYNNVVRHLDVLRAAVPRAFQYGLTLLAQFVADPTAVVDDSSSSVAEDVITFTMRGSFLACETISISAITRRNTRVGPVQLASAGALQPLAIPADRFTSRAELIAWLVQQRQGADYEFHGSLALPPSMNRADIIGFEVTRRFRTVNYPLASAQLQTVNQLIPFFGSTAPIWEQQGLLGPNDRRTEVLTATDLEAAVGGPAISHFYAAIEDIDGKGVDAPKKSETYANDSLSGTVLPPQPFPIPALQIAPILRYREILEIEKSAQHIIRNTTQYSKALWLSLTPDERAILLDGYTIGAPTDGLADPSQMIPLLNCVENRVLGTFGNSLMMPFTIPQDVADQMNIDPGELQRALLAYQKASFVPPKSTIALPTRGVLGEAVLGHCPSAEKIDLTRFWNWQDAPSDTAPGIGEVQLPTTTPPLTTGVTAPNSLTNLAPLINNVITAPQPDTSLLRALGQTAASQQDFSPTLTGQAQLATLMQNGQTLANTARQDALKTSQQLSAQAMATAGNIVGAYYGNPNAGSSAAAAMNGTSQPSAASDPNARKANTSTSSANAPKDKTDAPAQDTKKQPVGQSKDPKAGKPANDQSTKKTDQPAEDSSAPAQSDVAAPANGAANGE